LIVAIVCDVTGEIPASTLTDLLGAAVADVTARDIAGLIDAQVRETDELDFKATLYGRNEDAKVELCKDIAGLCNHRGGAVLLGVGEKDAVANGRPEVDLSDAEERRMRQIVATGTAPHAAFEIRSIPGEAASRGFYLLLAERSPLRPHAVLVRDGLRYPRRDGTTTRYLTEAEVADMYRDRFRGEKQQVERLEQITDEMLPNLDTSDDRTWLVVSLVPNSSGDLPISFDGLRDMEAWARAAPGRNEILDAFFAELPAIAGVGVERYTLTSPADERKRATYPCAVCFTDGAASTAVTIRKGEGGPQLSQDPVVLAAHLVTCAASSLRFAGRHAARAGARGDAVVHARIFGPHSLLAFNHTGLAEPYPHAYKVREARSSLTLPIDTLTSTPQDAFAATRLMLADIFNAYGCPEVPQIAPDGTLRTLYFPAGYEVAAWAERRGVPTTAEQITYRR
jgi:hypothetical protein